MILKATLLSFLVLTLMHSAAAGLEGIRNRADIEELERAVKATGNSDLTEDMEEIKYLAEKVELLRDEGKASDADRLQKRVNKKIETIHHDMSSTEGDAIENDRDSRIRDREAMRQSRDQKFRERMAERGHALPEDMDIPDHADMHEEIMKRHRERDSSGAKDIAERHKELIEHRQKDITARIEKAGFSAEEEAKLKEDLEKYLAIEKEVMESRSSDRKKIKDRKVKKTPEERLVEKEEMKSRRDRERSRMDEARSMRREIDSAIREKIAAGRELRM